MLEPPVALVHRGVKREIVRNKDGTTSERVTRLVERRQAWPVSFTVRLSDDDTEPRETDE